MGDKMINKFRLKISYNENKITLDVNEDITFKELSKIINEKLLLNKCKYYEFLHNENVIDKEDRIQSSKICDYLELDQELVYYTGIKDRPYLIKIIVWDYVLEVNDATMKKFVQLMKKVDQAKPKQIYYLNKDQRKFIDTALKDCYDSLKELNFGGEYYYHLLKNGDNYLALKLKYYMLDDKYEFYLFDTLENMNNGTYNYLITFYDTNRAYFKGYQGINRNIFILSGENDTIKINDFEYLYSVLNRLTYMFKDVEEDYLFKSHENILVYDIANCKYWTV